MHAELADGSTLSARAVVCATGVQWRRLELPLEDALEGSGVYYGAGTSEAASCAGEHVYVVGGANSAGQAAMSLAAHAARVTVGGTPNTAWAEGTSTARDARGFLLTGGDLTPEDLPDWPLARPPLHLETSRLGVFAAGDVCANSIKRVASAVGEGAMAIALTDHYLAETYG